MPKQYQKAERDYRKSVGRENLWKIIKYLGHDTSAPEVAIYVDRYTGLVMESAYLVAHIATGLEQIKQELAESQKMEQNVVPMVERS